MKAIITVAEAERLARGLLAAQGMLDGDAVLTARCIVMADVWGIASHGLLRLPHYLRRMAAGGYPPRASLEIRYDTGPVVAFNGGGGLGHAQLWRAANIAVERATEFGVAVVTVSDSGHCGALGLYTVPGLASGHLTLAFSNGPAVMPAWGGSHPILSTSPLAAGIPTRPRPTIVDLATSAVARGKIAARAASGESLPEGWALDADGRPTTDPQEALHGLLAPLGGPKGYALALMVEAMSGGLAGPNLAVDVPDMFDEDDDASPQRIGHTLITIDPNRFDSPGAVQARLDRLATLVDDGGRLPGAARTLPEDVAPDTELSVDGSLLEELRAWRAS
ncbi:Ldh family oxidoreductase [Humibacter soli]